MERQEVWPVNILAQGSVPWELPEGKHFPGAGRAGRARGRAERPQWTLVWWFSLDSPASPASGPGWALFSDLQPDPAPKQPTLGPTGATALLQARRVKLPGQCQRPPLFCQTSWNPRGQTTSHKHWKARLHGQTGGQYYEISSSNRLWQLRTHHSLQ